MLEVTSEVDSPTPECKKARIILADDHPLLRQALKNVLQKEPDFEVIAEAGDGEEAVGLATKLIPDIVIMDIGMPNLDGLEATRRIKAACPSVAVLILTVHNDIQYILGVLQAGASGYLTKTVYGDEVINTVRALISGETVLAPAVAKQVFKYALQHATKPRGLELGDKLSARELEVLRLVAKGISNQDIASRLGLGLRTIKGYVASIFLKLNVASRTEAVIIGLRKGILSKDDLE